MIISSGASDRFNYSQIRLPSRSIAGSPLNLSMVRSIWVKIDRGRSCRYVLARVLPNPRSHFQYLTELISRRFTLAKEPVDRSVHLTMMRIILALNNCSNRASSARASFPSSITRWWIGAINWNCFSHTFSYHLAPRVRLLNIFAPFAVRGKLYELRMDGVYYGFRLAVPFLSSTIVVYISYLHTHALTLSCSQLLH